MLAAFVGDLFEHGGERRQAGAAGQQQQRALDLAQVEAAQRPGQFEAVAGLGQAAEEGAHQPAGHVADQKAHLPALLQRAEGIGAGLLRARHLEIDVLAGQKGQPAQRFAADRQRDGAFRKLAHLADRRLVAALRRLADRRGRRHADHAVALHAHLTGQHVALGDFVVTQRVLDELLAEVVEAGLGLALARAAGTVTAVQRDVDALAIGGVGHRLAGVDVDETGHAVFEVQRDGMRHAAPRLHGSGTRRGAGLTARASARVVVQMW